MFTGIIKGLGTIVAVTDRDQFRVVSVDTSGLVPEPKLGASVAIDGVCLTIVKIDGQILTFDVMQETLRLATTGNLKVGDKVCIETPMKMGDEFGGHMVQGHVDGVATIVQKDQSDENTRIRFELTSSLGKYLIQKGSVTVDGISLTVCDPTPTTFDVWLLPLTLKLTTLGHKQVGDRVNIELDHMMKAIIDRLPAST
jgi:riboflavin synthase